MARPEPQESYDGKNPAEAATNSLGRANRTYRHNAKGRNMRDNLQDKLGTAIDAAQDMWAAFLHIYDAAPLPTLAFMLCVGLITLASILTVRGGGMR